MALDPNDAPVIVGVGQINDRPADPEAGLDPLDLMEAALRRADADAGGGWLEGVQSLALVRQISFPGLKDLPERLAARIAARPTDLTVTASPSGDSPVLLLNEAANRIAAGEIRLAAVAGAEALRTAAQLAARAAGGDASAHNVMRRPRSGKRPLSYRARYGLSAPVDVYPLYENACRAAWGQSLADAQRESGEIWSRFSEVAAANPNAWLRTPLSSEDVTAVSPDNRPIAFPYTKRMVANSSVNQGAAFLVARLGDALERGLPHDRLVHIGRGAAAHEPEEILQRDRYDGSASLEVVLRRVLEFNALTYEDLDCAELYSCFPCVPKMARRVIGWPSDRPASLFGGLTFGGGPIGNYMSHALASMTEALRGGPKRGLLFANGGFATHNHAIVLSGRPIAAAGLPCAYDVQAEADAARGAVPPVLEDYAGPAKVETYTVFYARDGRPKSGVVVGRSPEGARFLARVAEEDAAGLASLMDEAEEPVGSLGTAIPGPDGLTTWRA